METNTNPTSESANAEKEMPFLDHLEELRKRVIWSLVAFVALSFWAFVEARERKKGFRYLGWFFLGCSFILRLRHCSGLVGTFLRSRFI